MKRVVLVRPSGPRNVGMIARIAANFGPCEIALVAPERPSLLVHPEFEQMSHGVDDVRERCVVYGSLPEALADCTDSFGFTARVREQRPRADWRAIQTDVASLAADPSRRVALVFGNEVSGLTGDEAALVGELVHIATSGDHTSLNLAVATGVVLSDLFVEEGHRGKARDAKALSGEAREFLKTSMKHVFGGKIARTPAARRDILAMVDRVFARAPLENRDARAWHLILRSLGNELTPPQLGLDLSPKGARRAAAKRTSKRREPGE
ncbi:MAG: TrmH family RNA methyltransferase [Planctomycetota bacterium]